jgi:hypothetical protein
MLGTEDFVAIIAVCPNDVIFGGKLAAPLNWSSIILKY